MPRTKITSSEESEIGPMVSMLDPLASRRKAAKWFEHVSKHLGVPLWKVTTVAKRVGY